MKKNIILFILVLLFIVPGVVHGAEEEIIIKIDGTTLNTEGISPYIEKGTTFVPIRAISEALNYEVDWDSVNKIVTLTKDNLKVVLTIGKLDVKVNSETRYIPEAPKVIGGTTFLPVRFVSEIIGYEVYYNKEGSVTNINVLSPPKEIKIDKAKADKFVSDYIKSKGYELIEYALGDVTGDSMQDYVLLIRGSFDDTIVVIDGKHEVEVARTDVMKGYMDYSLDLLRITGENKKQIHYFADDGYGFRYIFDYDSNSLKNIYKPIEELKEISLSYSYKYFIDYPNLNKALYFKASDKVVGEINRNTSYFNPAPDMEEAIGYKSFIEDMRTPGEIKISYELKFYPLGNASLASIYHTYRWNDGNWEIKDVFIKTYDNSSFVVGEHKYDTNIGSNWCKDGYLHITKDNIDKIFKMTRNQVTNFCGKPRAIDSNIFSSSDYQDYIYDGYVMRYLGGSDKYPWGVSQINYSGGNGTVLGVKVGTKFADVIKMVGKPVSGDDLEDSGRYGLIYEVNGYNIYFLGAGPNGSVSEIYVKED